MRGVTVAEPRRALPARGADEDLLSGDRDDLRAGYEAAVALGFRSFVKVGRDPEADVIARVALVRELAGEAALVGADANGGWPLLSRASQPCSRSPSRGSRSSSSRSTRTTSRVCATYAGSACCFVADESVYSAADVRRIGRLGAADVVSIYVGKYSALERAVESARLAGELGMDVVIGANGEMGIGAAAQLHVACACERLGEIPHGIIGHHFYEEDRRAQRALEIDGVVARLPAGPGLGVEPSDEVRRRSSA